MSQGADVMPRWLRRVATWHPELAGSVTLILEVDPYDPKLREYRYRAVPMTFARGRFSVGAPQLAKTIEHARTWVDRGHPVRVQRMHDDPETLLEVWL